MAGEGSMISLLLYAYTGALIVLYIAFAAASFGQQQYPDRRESA
jgi:hypothetical protein